MDIRINVEVWAPSSWKLGSLPATTPPYGVVVVLGHPHYYPRFGFVPAKPLGIVWEHDAPDEAFMVKEIQEGALAHTRGVVKYRPEFATV